MKSQFKNILAGVCVLAVVALLSACSKSRSYTVSNQTGYAAKAFIYEYNNKSERVNVHTVTIANNEKQSFATQDKTVEKVKIYISDVKIFGYYSDYDKWVQQVFYLDKKKKTNIVVSGETIVGNKEP